jgi:hypothetical protein
MEFVWYSRIDGVHGFSDNALIECPFCGGFFWAPWWPQCGCCGKDVREAARAK